MPAPDGSSLVVRLLHRLVLIEPGEAVAVVAAFAYFFFLFTAYALLRPVRETTGITGGVENLQWLFTATFVAMLIAMPLFGLLSARVRRIVLAPWVNIFFVSNLAGFAAVFHFSPDGVWAARVFYVWLSVFNFFVISVAWSVMADSFRPEQARRLFAFIAAGMSTGGIVGPSITVLLVERIGHGGLMALSCILLGTTLFCIRRLFAWRATHGAGVSGVAAAQDNPTRAIGGNPFAGFLLVWKSPYLLGIAGFVTLLATATTFLYFEQARLVDETFPDPVRQTQVFGTIDFIVQALALLIQVFLTGRIATRLGVVVLLVAVPVVVAVGFVALAIAPVFAVLAVAMVLRRVGEYSMVRPGREMLFTTVDAESKYKAKNFIDTVVYRGGDAVSGWVKAGVDAITQGPSIVALIGAGLALLWGWVGYLLGRKHEGDRAVALAAQPVQR